MTGTRDFAALERAFSEALVAAGVVDEHAIGAKVDDLVARTPALGARVVARAWRDSAFKARLLADGSAAARELLGVDLGALKLIVIENTPQVHNAIVCTLCSCYPRMLLGFPPDWYKSSAYRSRMVREPRAVLAEFGVAVPDDVAVRVHDSTADMRYLVLPLPPRGSQQLGEDALAALVTRDAMIGLALVAMPS